MTAKYSELLIGLSGIQEIVRKPFSFWGCVLETPLCDFSSIWERSSLPSEWSTIISKEMSRCRHLYWMKNDSFLVDEKYFVLCKTHQAIIRDKYHHSWLMEPHCLANAVLETWYPRFKLMRALAVANSIGSTYALQPYRAVGHRL